MKVQARKPKAETHPRMLTLNDPQSMRINSELALEIGLNESVMLLQIEYLISISGHIHDDKKWTFQTLEDLKEKYFRWWSIATISRTLQALEAANFIHIGNFNKRKSDRTHWFALNLEGIANLKSVTIFQIEKCILQDEKSISHIATSILQDETTLPETSTEITTEKKEEEPSGAKNAPLTVEVNQVFEHWKSTLHHERAKLTPERGRVIRARLKDGYSVEEIKDAIDGCAASPFHQGKNDQGKVHDGLTLICRNGEKLEGFIQMKGVKVTNHGNGKPTNEDKLRTILERRTQVTTGEHHSGDEVGDKLVRAGGLGIAGNGRSLAFSFN